jgi:hypothetical protein
MAAKSKQLEIEILAVMENAFRAGSELALLDAISFCDETNRTLPKWVVKELAIRARLQAKGEKIKKKMGRHAFLGQQPDSLFDAKCFELVTDLREESDKKLKGADAFSLAATRLRSERETVRKAFYRFKNRPPSERYISLLYLQDPVAFLQHNSIL